MTQQQTLKNAAEGRESADRRHMTVVHQTVEELWEEVGDPSLPVVARPGVVVDVTRDAIRAVLAVLFAGVAHADEVTAVVVDTDPRTGDLRVHDDGPHPRHDPAVAAARRAMGLRGGTLAVGDSDQLCGRVVVLEGTGEGTICPCGEDR